LFTLTPTRLTTRAAILSTTVAVLCAGLVAVAPPASAAAPVPQLQTIVTLEPGTTTWTVPPAVTSIDVDLSGAAGGGGFQNRSGGLGGRTRSTLAVTPGEVLTVVVGGRSPYINGGSCVAQALGYNGGGLAYVVASAGGGATDIRRGAATLDDRLVVAGGGGGASDASNGGAGGSPAVASGPVSGRDGTTPGAGAGTQTAGGAAAAQMDAPTSYPRIPTAGSKGVGGSGGCFTYGSAGGGGGGGWFGGGGGAGVQSGLSIGGTGGGGGSSYGPANSTFDTGVNSGNGSAKISYMPPVVGPLDHLVIAPRTSTVSPGSSERYSVVAYDLYNNNLGDVTSETTFSVEGGTCSGAVCSALAAGDHVVTAAYSGKTVTGTLTTRGAATLTMTGLPSATVPGASHVVTITATDSEGVVATNDNRTLHFTSTDDNAQLPADLPLVAGVATATVSLANAGSQTVSASEIGSSLVATNTVAVSGAVELEVTGIPSNVDAGAKSTVSVTAVDDNGDVVTDYAGTVHFTSTDGRAVLPADAKLVNGTHDFEVALTTAGTQSITVAGVRNASLTGSIVGIAVASGALTQIVARDVPSDSVAGDAFTFTAQGADEYGNLLNSLVGTPVVASTDPDATFTASAAVSGQSTITGTMVAAGNQTLTVSQAAGSAVSGTASVFVRAGKTTRLELDLSGPDTAGSSRDLRPALYDAFGNPTQDTFRAMGQVRTSDAAVPAVPMYDAYSTPIVLKTAGSVDITAYLCDNLSYYRYGSSCVVIAQFSNQPYTWGVTKTISATVTPAEARSLTIASMPGTTVAGTAASIELSARDEFGNVTGLDGAVRFSSTDAKAVLPANAAVGVSGLSTSAVLRTAGVQSITATSVEDSTVTVTGSDVTVTAAAAAGITLDGYPSGSVAGDGIHSIAASAVDAFGNKAIDYNGTLKVTTTDKQAILPVPVTVTDGKGVVPVALRTAGSQTIVVRDSAHPTITGSRTVSIVAAKASRLALRVGSSSKKGVKQAFTLTAVDRFGNIDRTYAGKLAIAVSDKKAVKTVKTAVKGASSGTVKWATVGSRTIKVTDAKNPKLTTGTVKVLVKK